MSSNSISHKQIYWNSPELKLLNLKLMTLSEIEKIEFSSFSDIPRIVILIYFKNNYITQIIKNSLDYELEVYVLGKTSEFKSITREVINKINKNYTFFGDVYWDSRRDAISRYIDRIALLPPITLA